MKSVTKITRIKESEYMIILFLALCLSTNDFYCTSEFGNITVIHMCLALRPLHRHSISSI